MKPNFTPLNPKFFPTPCPAYWGVFATGVALTVALTLAPPNRAAANPSRPGHPHGPHGQTAPTEQEPAKAKTRPHMARHISQGLTWGGSGLGTLFVGLGMMNAFHDSGLPLILAGGSLFSVSLVFGPSVGNFWGGNPTRGMIFTGARLATMSAAWGLPFLVAEIDDEPALAVGIGLGLVTLALAIAEIAGMERGLEKRAKKNTFLSRLQVTPTLITDNADNRVPGAVIKATW